MHSTRAAAFVTAAALVAVLGVFAAPPAAAQDLGCSDVNGATGSGFSSQFTELTMLAGETVAVTISQRTDTANLTLSVTGVADITQTDVQPGLPVTLTYTFPAEVSDVTIRASVSSGVAQYAWTCAVPTPAPEPIQAAAIPAWVQAYGRFGADATCDDGWNASWQEWAVPVTGGWVCTRSVPSLG